MAHSSAHTLAKVTDVAKLLLLNRRQDRRVTDPHHPTVTLTLPNLAI